jgi:hypothetical protein
LYFLPSGKQAYNDKQEIGETPSALSFEKVLPGEFVGFLVDGHGEGVQGVVEASMAGGSHAAGSGW